MYLFSIKNWLTLLRETPGIFVRIFHSNFVPEKTFFNVFWNFLSYETCNLQTARTRNLTSNNSIDRSCKKTPRISFRIFSPYPSTKTIFQVRKMWFKHTKMLQKKSDFGPPNACISTNSVTPSINIEEGGGGEEHLEPFFRIFRPYPSPKTTFERQKSRIKHRNMFLNTF